MLSDATWDDDCPGRYYNALLAFKDPKQFIGLWNRPLFMLLFALPLKLGRNIIVFPNGTRFDPDMLRSL